MATATKTFVYEGTNKSGKKVSGKVEASSQAEVAKRLISSGLTPTTVRPESSGLNTEISLPGSNRVKMKDLAVMSRQFATMINSGLSLLRSLTILAEQSESKGLKTSLAQVRDEVEAGNSLSASLSKQPEVFPPLMINMIRAGEVGGFLDQVLLQIAESYEKEVALRAKVKSAMTYPVVVFVIAVIAVVGMLTFIVPVFEGMFKNLGGTLPLPTQILVWMSKAMRITLPITIVGIIVFGIVWSRIKNKESTRRFVDPLYLKLPVFGNLIQKIAISRFCRNFGTMLRSGVPILQCLDIVGDTSGNIVITDAIVDVQESVRRGESMTGPLKEHKVFPAMMVQMLAVGEDTGAMDEMMHKLSDFYDQEVEATTEALASLIEPLMIAVLGSVIGGMIVGLYMPIFSVFELIG